MFRTLWRGCKYLLRIVWKACKWLFLLTLPLTLLPGICGTINGLYFAYWTNNRVGRTVDALLHEVKDVANDWGIPGTMTFREFQDIHNDFHLLRINSNDWRLKLGFALPLEYSDWESNADTPVNNFANLDSLMVDTTSATPPKDQWVYISDFAFPSFNEWDAAFDAAVQAGYVPSALNETRLFFASCFQTAHFLCGVWGVRSPTLLHFEVDDHPPWPTDMTPGLNYATGLWNLRSVTVRVIEFPLKDAYIGLPSDVFPGPKEQILAIMRGDRLYEQFEEWNEMSQMMYRFQETIDNLYDRRGTFLYYLGKVDNWWEEHFAKLLGLEEVLNVVHLTYFVLAAGVVNCLILPPWNLVKQTAMDYLGYPKRGDWILGNTLEQPSENVVDDLIADMIPGFWESFSKKVKDEGLGSDLLLRKITTNSVAETTYSAESSATTA